MWRDILPSMVTHTRNLCSAFNPSKVHTHSSEQTFILWHPGSSWGFGALLKYLTSVMLLESWTFTPHTYNPCRYQDLNLI